ncbi:hypothetical protein [Nostoc sp.]|uniref:hypothetical protein n=1 Tax=Nostoc sp. TaxID=1180 RepID=UPI0035945E4A
MVKKLLLASIITLGSTCTLIPSANAQITNPEHNRLLQQTEQIWNITPFDARNYLNSSHERYLNYLYQLSFACANGSTAACNEFSARMPRQRQHLDNLQRQ